MILSRTLEGPANLNLLTLEARNASPIYDPVGLFEDLKNTPLYDAETGHWNASMNDNGEEIDACSYREDQLLQILIVSEFERHEAKSAYEELKDTPFYNKRHKQWNEVIVDGKRMKGEHYDLESRLLDILISLKFDRKAAKDDYDKLKNTSAYDKELDRWSKRVQAQDIYLSQHQLFGVLVCSELDLHVARKSYSKLKNSAFYDSEKKLWNEGLDDPNYCTKDNLIDVLVLTNLNITDARDTYERLKNTPLYHKEQKQWNWYMNAEKELQNSERFSCNQLLAVLIEAKLVKAFPETSLTVNFSSLPDIWMAR